MRNINNLTRSETTPAVEGIVTPATPFTEEERPRVSVLMPTFNQGSFICRALKSLLDQTMTQWEIVIVDDGSSDNTHKLI